MHSFARNPRALTQLSALAVVLALGLTVRADGMRDLVEAALDQNIKQPIEIPVRPVREALAELEKATGLRFTLDDKAIDWMPYGEQTRISLTLKDLSVRQGLTRILDGLGLRMRVEHDRVLIEPAPVLDRLGRRLTVDEVELLQKLAAVPWSQLKPGDIAVQFRLPPDTDPAKQFDQALQAEPPANALTQLESATQKAGWLWIPQDKTIAVYSRSEDIQQRLDRPLDLNYQRIPLDELLVDLGKRVEITVHFEPGALSKVSARDRLVDFVQRSTTLRQVLELISGRTGLHYDVVEDGIVVFPAKPGGDTATAVAQGASGSADPVVAILEIKVDGDRTIHYLVRASEMPTELKALREREMPAVIEIVKKRLAAGGAATDAKPAKDTGANKEATATKETAKEAKPAVPTAGI